jgi:hypothetical protein
MEQLRTYVTSPTWFPPWQIIQQAHFISITMKPRQKSEECHAESFHERHGKEKMSEYAPGDSLMPDKLWHKRLY